ncbi:MAG: hypothetical protein J6W70_02370, partial [Lentisphaeria bacterium]|nr:hypothetical protein [Lentisphaeria bacterium]
SDLGLTDLGLTGVLSQGSDLGLAAGLSDFVEVFCFHFPAGCGIIRPGKTRQDPGNEVQHARNKMSKMRSGVYR